MPRLIKTIVVVAISPHHSSEGQARRKKMAKKQAVAKQAVEENVWEKLPYCSDRGSDTSFDYFKQQKTLAQREFIVKHNRELCYKYKEVLEIEPRLSPTIAKLLVEGRLYSCNIATIMLVQKLLTPSELLAVSIREVYPEGVYNALLRGATLPNNINLANDECKLAVEYFNLK